MAVGNRAIVTSAALYAVAFLATTVVHEGAHFTVSLALGRHPVLFHNYVQSAEAGVAATVATRLAGPVFSGVQGAVLTALEPRTRSWDPVSRLLVVWLAFHGLMNAAGYVFTTAFAPAGDLGGAARLLGLPFVVQLGLTALGFWLIRVAARAIYPAFVALLPARATPAERNPGLRRLALLAWPLGVLLVLPASLPVPAWISLLYVVVAGVGAVWFTDFSKAVELPDDGAAPLPDALAVWPWIAWGLLTALCTLVLRHGLTLG